ncbi:adhesion G protein-coupled receptor E3-like [Antedon mediterranea]|uniref:adhesion G protein-coupled receptor E3-like n=1 Tax=Antedon mediterranea TaxID=105859 RepID=UPI003AF4F70C
MLFEMVQQELNTDDEVTFYCVYWDTDTYSSNSWSTYGCNVVSSNTTHTLCRCNHLTSFTVLFSLDSSTTQESNDTSLSVLSKVIISTSLICLVASGSIFIYVGICRTFSIQVHFSLCVALAIAQFLFLVGIERTENKGVCDALAILTHYSYTSALIWMLLEGVHLYMASRNYQLIRKTFYTFSGVGWVVPMILVACTYGIFTTEYRATELCWLSAESGSIFVFFATAAFVVLANSLATFLVIRQFMNLQTNQRKETMERHRACIKAVLFLQPILGLTWIFGLIAGLSDDELFSYMFVIFNGLQGVFIFFLHCLENNEVKKKIKLLRDKRARRIGTSSSQQTLTTHSRSGSNQTATSQL